jgi:hypothetical protein
MDCAPNQRPKKKPQIGSRIRKSLYPAKVSANPNKDAIKAAQARVEEYIR